MNLKDYIRSIPDYPKKGILFRDITTLIKDENAFAETINQIEIPKVEPDVVSVEDKSEELVETKLKILEDEIKIVEETNAKFIEENENLISEINELNSKISVLNNEIISQKRYLMSIECCSQ